MVKVATGNADAGINDERLKDVRYMRAICDASRSGDLTLYTSTLSLAECTYAGNLDSATKELFEKFLASGEVLVPISADFGRGIDARNLRWEHGIILKGADAIHVASAIWVGCKEFITTDNKIKNQGRLVKAIPQIGNLGLRIIRASESTLLPTEYLQDGLFDRANTPTKEIPPRQPLV